MSTQENAVSLKNCLEHHLIEIQWFSQKAVQKNCLISSMPRRAKRVAFSWAGKKLGSGWESHMKEVCQSYSGDVEPGCSDQQDL